MTTTDGWSVFDRDLPVLTYTYSFGPGEANTLAVGGEGGLIVVSPPWRTKPHVFEELESYGRVRALVASNAFHHMGIPEWKARFPDAAVFAPAQSVARVSKQTKLSDVRPLSEAASIAGPRVALIDMPYYRTGEVLVRIRASRGLAWYVTDIILNMREIPKHAIIGFLFKISNTAPGLRFNNIGPMFMVKDRKALRRWLADEFRKDPPQWLIPAHGEIADFAANPELAPGLFRGL